MPLHTIKQVSELVPGTAALIKRASLEQNLPTTTSDETLLSALELEYMMKVAHTQVNLEDAERVCRAVDLYGLRDEVKNHTGTMIKSASRVLASKHEDKREIELAEEFIDSQLVTMAPNLEKIAEACEELWDAHASKVTNDSVKLYAGAGTLNKSAALLALNHRAKRTGNGEFQKIASVVAATDATHLSTEDNRAILNAIKGLEKSAGYTESDAYTDMFMVKAAAVMVNLGTKAVNATDLVKVAGHAGSLLGDDIGSLLSDAHSNKDAIEALPLGEKQALAGLV